MAAIDRVGVIFVFALIAYLGFRTTRKIENVGDFLLAGRKLGRLSAGFSLSASEFGAGGFIGAVAACYSFGLAGIWWNWAAVVPFIALGLLFAPRLRNLEITTVPEYLERRYDRKTRLLATIMHICASIAGLSAQFTAAAVVLVALTGWSYGLCLTVATGFVIIYTMAGGFMADVSTDVFQFVIIIIMVGVSLGICRNITGGMADLAGALPDGFLDLGSLGFWEPFSWVLLCVFDYATSQYIVSRAFASRNAGTARFAFIFTGGFFIVAGAIIAFIGLTTYVLYPGLADPNEGFTLLVADYFPRGLAGLALGSILMATMSTADSGVIDVTTLVVNDIYLPRARREEGDRYALLISRVVTVVSCVLGVGLAVLLNNIIELIYLSGLFYGAAVFFPFVLGVFWKKPTAAAAFTSMVAAITAGIISEFFLCGRVDGVFGILPSNLVSALVGLCAMLGSSFILKKTGIMHEKR